MDIYREIYTYLRICYNTFLIVDHSQNSFHKQCNREAQLLWQLPGPPQIQTWPQKWSYHSIALKMQSLKPNTDVLLCLWCVTGRRSFIKRPQQKKKRPNFTLYRNSYSLNSLSSFSIQIRHLWAMTDDTVTSWGPHGKINWQDITV